MAKSFGETIREMREAQGLGLRVAAEQLSISPAYLSRIERGRERPPSSEIIKRMAMLFGGDPDVLFRLAESTDPDLMNYINHVPNLAEFLRTARALKLDAKDFANLIVDVKRKRSVSTARPATRVGRH